MPWLQARRNRAVIGGRTLAPAGAMAFHARKTGAAAQPLSVRRADVTDLAEAMADAEPPFFLARCAEGPIRSRGVPDWASDAGRRGEAAALRGAWSWRDGALTAQVDRYGFYSLYWYEKDGDIAVSPSLLKLVAEGCDPAPDDRALATFHRLGIFIHNDTPLRHVKVLPPGGRLYWDGRGPARITGGEPAPTAQKITRDGAVDGMIEHFRNAVARALEDCPGPFFVPLSGGRDSRHILLEVLHQGRRPEACVTFHHNRHVLNREAMAAGALCARLDVPHVVLGHTRPRLADAFRALTMTGLCADEHGQMMPLHDYFLDNAGLSFDGIAGDILTNPDNDADRYMTLSLRGDWKGIATELMAGHGRVISQPGWGQGAGPIYSPGRDEEIRDYLAAAIEHYADAPDPYQMFWMFHRTRREINFVPQAILGSARHVFCPYLDPDFVEFCISLPYSVTKDQQLHNDAIARAYPHAADIPYQEEFPEPPVQRGSIGSKLGNALDLLGILRALAPQRPLRAAAEFLGPARRLRRAQNDVYALHALCLEGLDADKARRLLRLSARLAANRPADLVSGRFPRG